MRTGKVEINGRLYTICLSTRVLVNLEDSGLSLDTIMKDDSHRIKNVFTLLSFMIDAGHRWDEKNGIPNAGTLTTDELMDSTAVDNYETIMNGITSVIAGERHIESAPPKKVETTQEENEASQAV